MRMHKNIRLLAWFNFLSDFRLYGPIIILYFTHVSGSFALGMSVFSITMLASAIFEVPTGVFSDKIGRKKTVVCGSIASVISVMLYAVGGTYGILVAGAIFEGLARSFFSGNNDALLHDTLAESGQQAEYQEFLGKTASMYQVALAIAAVMGGIIAAISYPVVMWLSVIPQVIGLIVSLQFVEPKVHTKTSGNAYHHLRDSFNNIVRNRRLRALSAASIVGFGMGESVYQFRAAFIATLWPLWAIGIARTIGNIGAAISFYLSGKIIKRFGEFRLLIVGISYSEIVNIFSLLVPTVFSPILMGSTSIFFGVNNVAVGGLMQREFTQEQRATMGSLNSFAGSIMFTICSLVLGILADQIGVIPASLVGELVLVTTIWLYWRAFRIESPKIQPEASVESL
jgi:MFS family permease